jgi:serine protease Do
MSRSLDRLGSSLALAADKVNSDPHLVEPDETLQLTGLEQRFQTIARHVSPSVVAISASAGNSDRDDVQRSESMTAAKLETVLDRGIRTVGTGFVVDPDGYIVTNEHVVGDSEQIWVTTDSGTIYPALVVGSDPRLDLAVLKIPATNLPVVKFAPDSEVHRGQWTIALGNPYGLAQAGEMAMSVGVVSAVERSLPKLADKEKRLYSDLIQTTAQINPGNSGGPLLNLYGQVIAINTAVILPQRQTSGIGFAIPINRNLLDIISSMKDGGEVVHGYLGVTVATPSFEERRDLNLALDSGARIEFIETNSPAAKVLKLDDMILAVNGESIHSSEHFVRTINQAGIAQPTELKIRRDGKDKTVTVQLARRDLPPTLVSRQNQRLHWRGLLLGPIPGNWDPDGGRKKTPTGLLVLAIDPKSPMTKQGIKQGSIITSVAGKPVSTVIDLQKVINDTPAEKWSVECLKPAEAVAASGR